MSTVTISEGWMTNFIYEQDLTSAYMNSALYSLFRPGVYNADIYVKPGVYNSSNSNVEESDKDGLSLIIKKGTTLVFSNDYFDDKLDFSGDSSHPVFRRSFTCENKNIGEITSVGSLIGNRFPILIKCVAMTDILVPSVAQSAKDIYIKDKSCQSWGDDTEDSTAPESLYLCAYMKYDQIDGGNFPSFPTFRLFRKNPYYGNFTEDVYKDKGRFFYIGTRVDDLPDTKSSDEICWRLPDGGSTYDGKGTSIMMQYSYLMLGVFADKNPPEKYEYFSLKNPSSDTLDNKDWFRNHTFSARCLPEYRNNMIGASNKSYPDFIIPLKSYTIIEDDENPGETREEITENPKFSRLYIDFKDVMNSGNIYNTSIDWESAYDIAETVTQPFPTFKKLAGNLNKDYISYVLTIDERNKINSNNDSLVLDFTYALSKNVLNTESSLDGGEDIISVSDIYPNSNNNTITLSNHREIIKLSSSDTSIIDALSLNENLMRLDISKTNTDRLMKFVRNKNILFRIMSKMRSSGEINPSEGESIIPIALAFRILKKEDNIIKGQYNDDISSDSSVNPINVLSLLDLEYKMTKLNSITDLSKDAFTILPVIE